MGSFDTAVARVLDAEGGYVWNPLDPGGETKFGVSKRQYPQVDIKNLTRQAAADIYRTDYWAPLKADGMPAWLAYQVLDFAVNSGVGTAVRKLQAALGLADDGHIGPVTTKAMCEADPSVGFLLLAERLQYLRKLSTFQAFGAGWVSRVANCQVTLVHDLRDQAAALRNPLG